MKIRICYLDGFGKPTKEIRVFRNPCDVIKYREPNGMVTISVRGKNEIPCHSWNMIEEIITEIEVNQEIEKIITFVVEDL